MCGIVGCITKYGNGFMRSDTGLFQQALISDSLRGVDSTGMFMVKNNRDVEFLKVASHPFRLLMTKDAQEILDESIYKGRVLVGHNRKATVGAINNDNAHPFQEGHIILVHNGSVSNAAELAKEHGAEVEVDSHIIAHILASEDNVVEALKKLRGSFAVVWYNQKDHTLNLVRNEDRPLYIAENSSIAFFVSEKEMLQWLLTRNRITAEIKEIPANQVISYNLSNGQPTTQKAEFKSYTSSVNYGNYGPRHTGGFSTGSSTGTTESRGATTTTVTAATYPEHGSIVNFTVQAIEPRQDKTTGIERQMILGVSDAGTHVRYLVKDHEINTSFPEWVKHKRLSGISGAVVWREGKIAAVWLDAIRVPKDEPKLLDIKTFNGVKLSAREWEHVYKNIPCGVCKLPLSPQWAKYTSFNPGNSKEPEGKVVCPECMVEKWNSWSPMNQANVVKAVGYSPMDYVKEKSAVEAPKEIQ